MFKKTLLASCLFAGSLLGGMPASAAVVTFDTLITGQTSYGFDGDGDGINDVIFTTADPLGFNTIGPGFNQTYVNEPGLEGTATLNPDLSVSFLRGAIGTLSFGFALDSGVSDPAYFASIEVFDASNTPLATQLVIGNYTATPFGTSSFPEGLLTVGFSGEAAYATFDFTSEFGRYIVDNFQGTFGSTERPPLPEPASLALFGIGLASLGFVRRRRT